jgi:hypothetical protein
MKHINFKKIVIALGIVIVLNLFFNYGIDTFYKGPKYDNFCQKELFAPQPQVVPQGKGVLPNYDYRAQQECQDNFNRAHDLYNRNVFIILIIAGIISIIIGFLISQSEAVSSGLSFGGLLSLIIGTIRYWSGMDDYLRFIILGAALAVLIWMGVKKLKDNKIN